jgi:leucyl-tRNA---protein transferase
MLSLRGLKENSFMFAEKHYPDLMLPEALDNYLDRGWYRMGQSIFTTHFLCFNRSYYSAVWVRQPLAGYRYSGSLRKIIRRCQSKFRTEFHQASITPEKEALYQNYRVAFPGMIAPSLQDSLLDGSDYNIFDTYEVCVYDGGKLVALSYFDLGARSVASIMGIYEPSYRAHSLGIYTMLMEIAFCLDNQLDFFYPGYVVPGYPRFDYKLRIGPVEYFDLAADGWRPFSELEQQAPPLQLMEHRLAELQQYLRHHQRRSRLMYYPLFEANLFGFWQAPYLDHPVFLLCSDADNTNAFNLIIYEPREQGFQLLRCSLFNDLHFYFNESYTQSFDPRFNFLKLLAVDEVLEKSPSPERILRAMGG